MTNCQDLCTASKCQELEARIQELEDVVEQLKQINLSGIVTNDDLQITVANGFDFDTATIDMATFALDRDLNNHISTQVNESEGHIYEPDIDVDLSITEYSDDLIVSVTFTLDDRTVGSSDNLEVETGSSTIAINGSVADKKLQLTVSSNQASDTATIDLPFVYQEDFDEHLQQAINIAHNFRPTVNLTVYSANEQTRIAVTWYELVSGILETSETILPIDDMDFSEVIEKIEQCCETLADKITNEASNTRDTVTTENDQNQAIIDSLTYQLDLRTGQIESKIDLLDFNCFSGNGGIDQATDDLLQQILSTVNSNYQILGGSFWSTDINNPSTIRAETKLRKKGREQYTSNPNVPPIDDIDNEVPVTNLIDLIEAYTSINYHRSGFQRLPATTVDSLIKTDNETEIELFDTLSFQEWSIKQLDAIVGQYPVKLEYKVTDVDGNTQEQEIEIANISEALTQILGLNIATSEETDNILNAVMRCLVEARSSANAAILAHDYAKANAQYLGYRGRQKKKEVDVAFTPGAGTLRETLQPSQQNIIGWDIDDNESLVELMKRILFSADIVKAALFIPFQSDGKVTGDAIKEKIEKEQQKSEEQWQKFKNIINNPTARYQTNKPSANIRDLTIDS